MGEETSPIKTKEQDLENPISLGVAQTPTCSPCAGAPLVAGALLAGLTLFGGYELSKSIGPAAGWSIAGVAALIVLAISIRISLNIITPGTRSCDLSGNESAAHAPNGF